MAKSKVQMSYDSTYMEVPHARIYVVNYFGKRQLYIFEMKIVFTLCLVNSRNVFNFLSGISG